MRPKRVIDLTMWLDPGEIWKRRPEIPFDPATIRGSSLWGGLEVGQTQSWTHFMRDWLEECRVERNIEAPPRAGLVSTLHIYCHSGTHVDTSFQDDPKGRGLWETPIEDFCSYAVNLDLSFVGEGKDVTAERLREAKGVDKLEQGDWVFVSSNCPSYRAPRLVEDGAEWLLERGIRGFGHSRSVDEEMICHKMFHSHDLVVIDSLDRDAVTSVAGKRLWTVAFPLAIKYLEASPCRVVAFEE